MSSLSPLAQPWEPSKVRNLEWWTQTVTQSQEANPSNSDPESKKRKRKEPLTPAQQLKKQIFSACSRRDAVGGIQAYKDAKEAGVPILPQVYNSLIALCSGLDQSAAEAPIETQFETEAFAIYEDARQNDQVKLQEAAYTTLIRLACRKGEVVEGERLMREMRENGELPRLRSFLPLLEGHCAKKDAKSAFTVYEDIRSHSLTPGEREYILLVRVAADCGAFEQGWLALQNMMEDVLRPKRSNWAILESLFRSHSDAWTIVEDVEIGEDGVCPVTGLTLQSIDLTPSSRERMIAQVQELALKGRDAESKWPKFVSWLEKKGNEAFDVLIDGANVGYYKQNFPGAPKHVSYEQIDAVAKHFLEAGHRPLIFLHQRHLFVQNLPKEFVEMTQRWREQQILYTTPPGCNDDWYWMYAAVWLAGQVQVVTNDEMRDHHFQMLSHRSFQRWKERHQTHFSFTFDPEADHRVLETFPPTSYSIRVQLSPVDASSFDEAHTIHVPSLRDTEEERADFVGESRTVDPASVSWLCITKNPTST